MAASTNPGPVAGEQVVLLDEQGQAVGTADKQGVHHTDTPLHLAFSCYVFDPSGRLLVTRRALHKATFPGVWTNSCCGHPGPGEPITDAVHRRVRDELGMTVRALRLVLPAFRYTAAMPGGVVENEMCPVLVGVSDDQPTPDPDEVAAVEWCDWRSFRAAVLDGSRDVSRWCALQVAELPEDPLAAHAAPADLLPPAARP